MCWECSLDYVWICENCSKVYCVTCGLALIDLKGVDDAREIQNKTFELEDKLEKDGHAECVAGKWNDQIGLCLECSVERMITVSRVE